MLRILFAIFIALFIYRNLFAGVLVDAGSFLESMHRANHWAGLAALAIATNLCITLGRMQPLTNPDASKARAFGIIAIVLVMLSFLAYEYSFVLQAAWYGLQNIFEWIFG